MQRAYERGIRATKRKLSGLDEGIKAAKDEGVKKELSDAFAKAGLKLKNQEAALSDFLEQTGFKREYDRTQVLGFDRSLSGKAKAAAKKELINQQERDIIKAIKKIPIQGEIHLKPVPIDTDMLSFDNAHVNGERGRSITEEEAKSFIKNAKISSTVWNGKFERYYSDNGASYVNMESGTIRTAYARENFGRDVIELLEVLKKYDR